MQTFVQVGIVIAALTAWHSGGFAAVGEHAFDRLMGRVPARVRTLAGAIQKKGHDPARAEIVRAFGEPARDVGSGVHIEEWDVDGGTVVLNGATGAAFRFASGEAWSLARTETPVHGVIAGDYEAAIPALAPATGTQWVGALKLGADGSYRFEPQGMYEANRDRVRGTFLGAHPAGRYVVHAEPGLAQSSLLEQLGERQRIATLELAAGNAVAQAVLVSDLNKQVLVLEGSAVATLQVNRAWGDRR